MPVGGEGLAWDKLVGLAASRGSHRCLQEALNRGGKAESGGGEVASPLVAACSSDSDGEKAGRCVEMLIAAGADIERRVSDEGGKYAGGTPLMYAARMNSERAIAALLSAGASVDAVWRGKDGEGETALMLAAKHGSLGCARRLLEAGADPSARSGSNMSAMDWAIGCRKDDCVELLEAWIEKRALEEQSERASREASKSPRL
jgi:hypothetical protein